MRMLREHRNNMDMETSAVDNGQNGYREYHFTRSDGDDIFGDLFGNMFRQGTKGGNFYSGGFHNGSGFYQQFHQGGNDGFYGNHGFHGTYSGKGENLEAEISLTFDEAAFGCDKMITLQEAGRQPHPESAHSCGNRYRTERAAAWKRSSGNRRR